MTLAFVSHPDCALHDPGDGHPERAARLTAIQDQLLVSGLDWVLKYYLAPLASREQLCRVHTPSYVDDVFRLSPADGRICLDADTSMSPGSLSAARHAAGAAIMAVDLVLSGQVHRAFCNVRPPGHHAEPAKAMGFCIFNNIAVAAEHALCHHGLKRIAIVDFDVHHGNGTEAIFRDKPEVLLCSTFQHPFYPFSGSNTVSDHIINTPLPEGTDGSGFREAVRQQWLPALRQFAPELIFISAGFDAHVADGMGGLELTESDYDWVTREIVAAAEPHAQGRIVSVLEGGYELSALAQSCVAHINALLD
ncbi:MAG: deacetylase [Zetaproteobacteria bacterium CG02_land_8_20_14_3_00_50_9]|nr:MAG: deacetylase [Zetaproteobacteria bacterium CG17_big_fil_post_rev_8_21_14_2_50_50_13]PIV29131.1 MAG: deacetylase [Zetaproteobacteria bacterium CG02_land_8_20_14_3_00_50_9]